MQDLKVGYMVKSTPYKLQIMQLIGTIIPALVIPVVTSLVIKAYGIAGEASEEYPYPLPAPQANLMADVAEAIFDGTLPYTMILIGGILAIIVIASDFLCMIFKLNFRIAVLAVSLGLYIPMDVILTIFIGGILSSIVLWILSKYKNYTESWMEDRYQVGILLSAGLITGEALCGIITAVPIVLSGKNDILAIFDVTPQTYLGLLCLLISMLLLIFIPTYPVFSPLFEKFQKTNK